MYQSKFIEIKPISINNCFQGRRFRTKEFKHWQWAVISSLPKIKIESKEIQLYVTVYLKHPLQSDLDNFLKPLIDCIVKKGIIKDDRYIHLIQAFKKQSEKEGFEIKIDSIINLIKPGEKAKETVGERFIDCGDGTIKDTKTKLMWQKEGSQERLNYKQAEEFVAELNKEQYPDWRIPTREELESILDLTKHNPAINPMFKCESAGYWSSTPYAVFSDYAWLVGFNFGGVYDGGRYLGCFVRPVRQYF